MRAEDVRHIYGPEYAAVYDGDWQESEVWGREAAHHVATLRSLIHDGTRWLDVGCGTGWFLSRFPGVERAGLDLSPAMLDRARENNPDIGELREASMTDDVPEWEGAWDLVSCTGQPWGYLGSLDQIERSADNMARWTAPGGVCFVQPVDFADLTGHLPDYRFDGEPTEPWTAYVTGTVWRWIASTGHRHHDMVFPTLDLWVWWMGRHFRRIDIRRWPHDPPPPYVRVPRRVLLCSEKRVEGDDGAPAVVVEHPVPPLSGAPEPDPTPVAEPEPGVMSDPVIPSEPSPEPEIEGPAATPAATGPRHRPGRPLPGRLVDQPLTYLLGRAKPWDPRFWHRVRRRLVRPRS